MAVIEWVRRGKRGLTMVGLFALLAAAAGMLTSGSGMFGAVEAMASSSARAPGFELTDLNGVKVSLEQYKGKQPVLLYFGAKWCPACEAIKPRVIEMRNRVKREDLEILEVYVGVRDTIEAVRKHQERHPVPFPILFDEGGQVSSSFNVRGIPTFVLVNKDGNIVYRDYQPPENFKQYL
ncbi:MAG: TlpA family protein disulfide reductase [Syntrophobacteraceae bacterium]